MGITACVFNSTAHNPTESLSKWRRAHDRRWLQLDSVIPFEGHDGHPQISVGNHDIHAPKTRSGRKASGGNDDDYDDRRRRDDDYDDAGESRAGAINFQGKYALCKAERCDHSCAACICSRKTLRRLWRSGTASSRRP